MLHHSEQARIAAEQILPEISAALDEELLVLTVGNFAQSPHEQSIAIVLDQAVPIAAPDDLDHVPAGAAENRFKFLNDFSIATHGTIESLKVAVDHPYQIVELL